MPPAQLTNSTERLPHREFGNASGPTIVFIHGWPDTYRVYQKQYPALEKDYRLVVFSLPWYDREVSDGAIKSRQQPYLGTPLMEVCSQFYNGIKHVMNSRPKSEKPMLVCHDWGSSISWIVVERYPELFSRIVCLDIGQHHGKLSGGETMLLLFYQWTLAFLTLLPSLLTTPLTKLMAWGVFGLQDVSRVHGSMNYMYFQTWKLVFSNALPNAMTKCQEPPCPTLFLYGTKMPIYFHSKRWKEMLQATPGSGVIPCNGSHWFFTEPQCVEEVNKAIVRFLKQN